MSPAEQAFAAVRLHRSNGRGGRPGVALHGSDFAWAIAFVVPYVAVFLAFVVYPVAYGLWMGSKPVALRRPVRRPALPERRWSTRCCSSALGVNVKMFLALAAVGLLHAPPLVDQGPAGDLHAALGAAGDPGLHLDPLDADRRDGAWSNSLLEELFGIEGPIWFGNRWLALGCNIVAYIWKWLPFWTLIFWPAGWRSRRRSTKPPRSTARPGCAASRTSPFRCWRIFTSSARCSPTLWTIGDFNTAYFVSERRARLNQPTCWPRSAIRYAFDGANPNSAWPR